MDKDRSDRTPNVIEGADAGALGTNEPPHTAPEGARVDATERRVPGADFDDHPPTEEKPWFTSLAADSEQAGVANADPDDAAPPAYERPDYADPADG